jgi:hypothetical protein
LEPKRGQFATGPTGRRTAKAGSCGERKFDEAYGDVMLAKLTPERSQSASLFITNFLYTFEACSSNFSASSDFPLAPLSLQGYA